MEPVEVDRLIIAVSETYDVIAYNKVAIVVTTDGLYQYDYSDVNNIHLLSKIPVLTN